MITHSTSQSQSLSLSLLLFSFRNSQFPLSHSACPYTISQSLNGFPSTSILTSPVLFYLPFTSKFAYFSFLISFPFLRVHTPTIFLLSRPQNFSLLFSLTLQRFIPSLFHLYIFLPFPFFKFSLTRFGHLSLYFSSFYLFPSRSFFKIKLSIFFCFFLRHSSSSFLYLSFPISSRHKSALLIFTFSLLLPNN